MSRARPFVAVEREGPLESEDRSMPIPLEAPPIILSVPSKKITPGDRVYPFAGLTINGPAPIASARWRKGGGSYSAISLGVYTDILSAIRFVSEVVNIYGTVLYEVEITDEASNVVIAAADVVSSIQLGISKIADNDTKFRPFCDSLLATDASQIASISYSVAGDATVTKTAITRPSMITGAHSGSSGAAALTDAGRDFTTYEILLATDIIQNTTDGSEGVITEVTATTVTATLDGGTDDDWDTSDAYKIVDGGNLDFIAKGFEHSQSTAGFYIYTLYVVDGSTNESSAFITARIS